MNPPQNTRCWPLVHLNAGDGTTRCGRQPPPTLISWTNITCPDCANQPTKPPPETRR